jgi:hypothetical protein
MVSHAKKVAANSKLQDLNLPPAGLLKANLGFNKLKQLWYVCRQMYYVPFIWSLTWYMFWILRDFIIFGKPVTQTNPLNCVGTVISVSALMVKLFAVQSRFAEIARKAYVSTKSQIADKTMALVDSHILLKIRSSVGRHVEGATRFLRSRCSVGKSTASVLEEPALKRTIQYQGLIEEKPRQHRLQDRSRRQMKDPQKMPAKLLPPRINGDLHPKRVDPVDLGTLDKIAENCLVCPDLVHCSHRQERAKEQDVQICCRYSTEYATEVVAS